MKIDASNGGGLVSNDEMEQAIGTFFLMRDYRGYQPSHTSSIEKIDEQVSIFRYRGRVYRAHTIFGFVPGANQCSPIRLHFDYIRQCEETES